MRSTPVRVVLLLIAGATLLRLALAAITDLGLDEAYALAVSRQFQLSWFDHPPLLFWITGAMQAAFGLEAPPVLLRLPFILLSAATTWMLFRLTVRHFENMAGLWAVVLFTAAPFFFLSAGSLLVPDGLLSFFLIAAALFLSSIAFAADRDSHWRDWLLAGSAIGLALLSKYHAVPFVAGALLYLALSPRLWFWLRRPQPYVAVLLALVIFVPVLVWNAQNDWVSLAFQLGRGTPLGTTPERIATLFLVEVAYLLPTTALLMIAAIGWSVRDRIARRPASFFLALGVPTILLLDLPRFWTAEGFSHWSMPGWLMLFPLAGAMVGAWQSRWRPAGWLVEGLTALQLATLIVGVMLFLSSFRLDNAEMDAFRVEAGSWSGFAEGLKASGAIGPDDVFAATSWRDASRVAEALRLPNPVMALEANAHGFAWTANPNDLLGRDVLLVSRTWDTEGVLRAYEGMFERVEPVGTWLIEAGSPYAVDVVRGHRMIVPYPMAYPDR